MTGKALARSMSASACVSWMCVVEYAPAFAQSESTPSERACNRKLTKS